MSVALRDDGDVLAVAVKLTALSDPLAPLVMVSQLPTQINARDDHETWPRSLVIAAISQLTKERK
jgi:hypothetical protein